MIQQLHARLFDIDGRQVLAYLDHDDNDQLFLAFRLWGVDPVGPVEWGIHLPDGASENAVRIWEDGQRQMLADLTEDRCRMVIEKAGILSLMASLANDP